MEEKAEDFDAFYALLASSIEQHGPATAAGIYAGAAVHTVRTFCPDVSRGQFLDTVRTIWEAHALGAESRSEVA